jgi:voltage-gated potassium channel
MATRGNSAKTQPTGANSRSALLANWERRSGLPLALLALAYMGLWAVQVLVPMPTADWDVIEGVILLIWAVFIADFVIRLVLHTDKKHFLRSNVIELTALLLPAFRFLRVLRVITAIGILSRVVQTIQGRVNLYITLMLPMFVLAGSIGVLEAERNAPGATIHTFGDSLWFTAESIFTIGYGDFYPVSWEGRIISLVMMLGGYALLSVVAVNLAAYLLRNTDFKRIGR